MLIKTGKSLDSTAMKHRIEIWKCGASTQDATTGEWSFSNDEKIAEPWAAVSNTAPSETWTPKQYQDNSTLTFSVFYSENLSDLGVNHYIIFKNKKYEILSVNNQNFENYIFEIEAVRR